MMALSPMLFILAAAGQVHAQTALPMPDTAPERYDLEGYAEQVERCRAHRGELGPALRYACAEFEREAANLRTGDPIFPWNESLRVGDEAGAYALLKADERLLACLDESWTDEPLSLKCGRFLRDAAVLGAKMGDRSAIVIARRNLAIELRDVEMSREDWRKRMAESVVGEAWNLLGFTQYAAGNVEDAIDSYRRALASLIASYDAEIESVLLSRGNLAMALAQIGQSEEAERLLRLNIEISDRKQYADDGVMLQNLAVLIQADGRLEEADGWFERAVQSMARDEGNGTVPVLEAIAMWADNRRRMGDLGEALPLLETAVLRLTEILGEANPRIVMVRQMLAKGYRDAGRLDEAAATLEDNARLAGSESVIQLLLSSDVAFRRGNWVQSRAYARRVARISIQSLERQGDFDRIAEKELESAAPAFLMAVKANWALARERDKAK